MAPARFSARPGAHGSNASGAWRDWGLRENRVFEPPKRLVSLSLPVQANPAKGCPQQKDTQCAPSRKYAWKAFGEDPGRVDNRYSGRAAHLHQNLVGSHLDASGACRHVTPLAENLLPAFEVGLTGNRYAIWPCVLSEHWVVTGVSPTHSPVHLSQESVW